MCCKIIQLGVMKELYIVANYKLTTLRSTEHRMFKAEEYHAFLIM